MPTPATIKISPTKMFINKSILYSTTKAQLRLKT